MPLTTPWLAASIVLFFVAGACWIPVLWLQLRMSAIVNESSRAALELPPLYWRYARCWERLGYPAFAALRVVSCLMVAKPALSL